MFYHHLEQEKFHGLYKHHWAVKQCNVNQLIKTVVTHTSRLMVLFPFKVCDAKYCAEVWIAVYGLKTNVYWFVYDFNIIYILATYSTIITGWMPTLLRAGRGMALWDRSRKEPPPKKLELFSYENNPVRLLLNQCLFQRIYWLFIL